MFCFRVPARWNATCASFFGVSPTTPLRLSYNGYPVGVLQCFDETRFVVNVKWNHGVFALRGAACQYPARAAGFVLLDHGRAVQFFGKGGAAEVLVPEAAPCHAFYCDDAFAPCV
jgi:hypothetical protein